VLSVGGPGVSGVDVEVEEFREDSGREFGDQRGVSGAAEVDRQVFAQCAVGLR
jgi:hypothetical protein